MATTQKVITTCFDFFGGGIIPATGSADSGRLVQKITGAGPPTAAPVSGELVLALEATNEAQNVCVYQDDDLSFDIDNLKQVRFWVKKVTTLGANAKWRVGLAAARNDDPDAITASILFGSGSTNAITAESDDGTNETVATATGISLGATYQKMVIDFSKGIHSQSPPSLSLGGKNAVQMFIENANGLLTRVCGSTRFNMNAHSTGLQVFVQLQKSASTNVGSIAVHRIEVDHVVPG